jgi:hypothetical protein
MVEWLLDSVRRIDRARNEIPQPVDGARLICARRYGDLVHAALNSLFVCVLAARHASPFVRVMRRPYESSAGLSRERPWQSIPKGRHEKSEGAQAPSPVGLSGVVPQRPPPPAPDPPEPDVLGGLAPPSWGVGGFVGRDWAVATAMPTSSAAPASKLVVIFIGCLHRCEVVYASFERPTLSGGRPRAQARPPFGARAASSGSSDPRGLKLESL